MWQSWMWKPWVSLVTAFSQLHKDDYYCIAYEHEDVMLGVLNLRLEEQLHHTDRIAEISL